MIKESWNLIVPEAQLATHNQQYVYTISDNTHTGMEIIPERLSVYTTAQICVFIFISDSNHNATISKVVMLCIR